jgi:uncharacterized membrane protein YdjX (TVP38/TMEM64 family)
MPDPLDTPAVPDDAAPDGDAAATPDGAPESATNARPLLKLLLIVLSFAVFAAIIRFTPLRHFLDDIQSVKEWILGFGHFSWIIFILICVVTLPMGMPRLALCVLAGLVFNFKVGLPLAMFGTVLGAYVNFIGARFLGKTWGLKKKLDPTKPPKRSLDNPTLTGVIIMRQMPIYGHAVNVLLGLSRCGHGKFLLGTAIGFLPQAIVAVLVGSGVFKEDAMRSIKQIGGAIGILVVCALIATWVIRRYRANIGTPPQPPK